jgi:integrase
MPESTRRAYRSNVAGFMDWCRDTGRPGLPIDGDTLTEYATYLCDTRGLAPVSVERARWAILKWHSLAGYQPPGTEGLIDVLKGYRARLARTKSPKAKPRKATAASPDALRTMLATLDRSAPAGQRNAAMILLGFSIAARRGEIASLDIGDIDTRDAGIQVSVYREKVREMDDPVVKYRPDAELCPVRAALTWMATLAASGRETGPLFVRITWGGRIGWQPTRDGVPIGDPDGRMSGQAVADVIRQTALAAGLGGRWSGHSLRRGFATSAHNAEIGRRYIERQGGWMAGSKAVSGYIDDADRWLYDVLEGVL